MDDHWLVTNGEAGGFRTAEWEKRRYTAQRGHVVAQLVEALRFKSEAHGFDS